jgi:hypothetical protein
MILDADPIAVRSAMILLVALCSRRPARAFGNHNLQALQLQLGRQHLSAFRRDRNQHRKTSLTLQLATRGLTEILLGAG